MRKYSEVLNADFKKYGEGGPSKYDKLLLSYLRKYQFSSNKLIRYYYRKRYNRLSDRHCMEIPCNTQIGKGFMLCHTFNITINSHAVIGDNVSIHKGVLIGKTNRGHKMGCPTIGNQVWIGINAAIVGGITVGDDVLIAPNTYVNVDIPSHSVVYGNPCIIKHKDNATEDYIRIIV